MESKHQKCFTTINNQVTYDQNRSHTEKLGHDPRIKSDQRRRSHHPLVWVSEASEVTEVKRRWVMKGLLSREYCLEEWDSIVQLRQLANWNLWM